MTKKGDVVAVHAVLVKSAHPQSDLVVPRTCVKQVNRREITPWSGLVVGTSYITLRESDKRIPIILIQQLRTEDWFCPIPCLGSDIHAPLDTAPDLCYNGYIRQK